MGENSETIDVLIEPRGLEGILRLPRRPMGLIIFAHGSGSSRFSPRNSLVARQLSNRGFATLLFDLLTAGEEQDRRNVFDIPLLSSRVGEAVGWASTSSYVAATSDWPIRGQHGRRRGARRGGERTRTSESCRLARRPPRPRRRGPCSCQGGDAADCRRAGP